MPGYYDADGTDIFKDAVTAFSKVISTLTITSGDATGFFEDAGTKYIIYQPYDSNFSGKWADSAITLPSAYIPKSTEVQLAKKGSCPIPAYPSSELRNRILYTNDTTLSETLYYFLAKNPTTKCLRYFTMTEKTIKEKNNTADKRKAFFDPWTPKNRESYWQDIPNTEHVKVIIIHLIGPGGDGGAILDSGGKAGGGGASGPAYSVIYDGVNFSDEHYEVFKITTDKTCWFSAERYSSANFNPVDRDQHEGDQWTKLVKVANKGNSGYESWTNAPYSKGGAASTTEPANWASTVNNWGSTFDEHNCIRLEPLWAGRSGYDAGSDYRDKSNGVTSISLGYAGICEPVSIPIPTNYRTHGSPNYGYAGRGGKPAIHLRKAYDYDWPNLGEGGRGAYRNNLGEKIAETKGTIGGVIIEYEA